MKIIITESQIRTLLEYSYMGKYEGDLIRIGDFKNLKLPKPILMNVLKSISKKTGLATNSSKFKNGDYDDVEIILFGQLFAFLTGRY